MITSLDENRNKIHDSLESVSEPVKVGISYDHEPNSEDVDSIIELGYSVNLEVPEVNEYVSVTGSFALAAKEPLNILSSSTEIEFGASVIANGTLASPPPPPPPQEEIRTSNAINFKDFIYRNYTKKRGLNALFFRFNIFKT